MFEFLLSADQPFETLTWWMILTVALVHAVGCFIRGAYGFGSNMPIVVATTFIIGPHHAILLALMTTIICQIHLMPSGFKTADWQVAKTLIPGMIIGSLFGTWAFTFLSGISLQIILGILIVGIIVMDTFKLVEKLTNKFEIRSPKITGSFSFISGTMGGVKWSRSILFSCCLSQTRLPYAHSVTRDQRYAGDSDNVYTSNRSSFCRNDNTDTDYRRIAA